MLSNSFQCMPCEIISVLDCKCMYVSRDVSLSSSSSSPSYDFSDALHTRSIIHCFLAGCARLPQQF